MDCKKCGANNPENMNFCQSCGEPLEQAVNQQYQEQNADAPAEKKKLPVKLIGMVAAAVAVIIILIAIISACASSGGDVAEGDFRVIYTASENVSAILYNGEVIVNEIEGEISISEDEAGTMGVFKNADGELYKITKKGIEKLIDGVVSFKMASTGDVLAFTDDEGAFYLYSVKNGKKTRITDDRVVSSTFSRGGKALAYKVAIDKEEEPEEEGADPVITTEYTSYVYYKDESVKIGKDISISVLSDDAKYIYYSKDNEGKKDLYLTNLKDEKVKIASDVQNIIYSADRKQIIFRADGKWYASVKGGEKVKVEGVSNSVTSLYTLTAPYSIGGVEKLQKNYYIGYTGDSYTLYYIDGNWNAEKLASNIDNYYMAEDGETIYYSKDDKVYILGNEEAIEKEVSRFRMTIDGSAMYFLNEDDTLYYKKGTKEKVRIADDVESLAVTHDGIVIFKDEDDVMYASNKGKTPEKIAEDAGSVVACLNYTYIKADVEDDGTCNILVATSKAKFEKVLSEVCTKLSVPSLPSINW